MASASSRRRDHRSNKHPLRITQITGIAKEQVRAIRDLAIDHSVETIAERIGARNKEQVQRVIDGETYSRVI
ncbi:hypothetical protein NWI01_12510 [Nitrobacter winogradskyi]|uniref:Uncharacterized protein n=1 Tax=Nitrobacter winogradskyi TaxID=913 RepID=A0A4Y3WBW8_NITWI|nr:hypothetical protein NWI01_12510 [Nitrobacter winogradskyi]